MYAYGTYLYINIYIYMYMYDFLNAILWIYGFDLKTVNPENRIQEIS